MAQKRQAVRGGLSGLEEHPLIQQLARNSIRHSAHMLGLASLVAALVEKADIDKARTSEIVVNIDGGRRGPYEGFALRVVDRVFEVAGVRSPSPAVRAAAMWRAVAIAALVAAGFLAGLLVAGAPGS